MTAYARGENPLSGTEFIGRYAELRRVHTLLSVAAPLVTLIGPGGIGKTRLAAEIIRSKYTAGWRIHWVRLARLSPGADVETVTDEVVRSIAVSNATSNSSLEALVTALTDPEPTLLVLDNCEHLPIGVGRLIADIVSAVPGLMILATSREPIGWDEEHIVAVGPLPARQALELFRRRARRIGRPVADGPEALTAGLICRHVDNNPLFIRLASARLRDQTLDSVMRELTGTGTDRRLTWIDDAQADIELRHRRVLDVIAWSFELCGTDEQLLLQRLSVFAAGYESERDEPDNGADLDAIVEICGDRALTEDRIEPLLERLAECSLVSAHITTTDVRYYLLESVRVFARDRLHRYDAAAAEPLARKHLRYHRDRVLAGQAAGFGPEEARWLNWIRASWDNILTAIETSLGDPDEAVIGLETATVLMTLRIPFLLGENRALTQLTERALAATRELPHSPPDLRIRALAMVAWAAMWQGRGQYTTELLNECVGACVASPDIQRTWSDRPDTDIGLPPLVEFTWGLKLMLIDQDPCTAMVFDRARRKYLDIGDRFGDERSQLFAAFGSAFLGNREQALDHTGANLRRAINSGSAWSTGWAELARAVALTKHGHSDEALEVAHSALSENLLPGDLWTENFAVLARLMPLVRMLAERIDDSAVGPELTSRAIEIACLVGGFTTKHHFMGIASERVPLIAAELRAAAAVATRVLGPAVYAAAEQVGSQFPPESDELRRYALGTLIPDGLPIEQPIVELPHHQWSLLTQAEEEVAILVAARWSNREIAARRGSSVRTVDRQVETIREKLMIKSRTGIDSHVPVELASRVRQETADRPPRARRPHKVNQE